MRATKSVRWSTALIEVLLDELYVADDVEKLLGPIAGLRHARYPQAIALALVLRHSWRADDLTCMLKRLGLVETSS